MGSPEVSTPACGPAETPTRPTGTSSTSRASGPRASSFKALLGLRRVLPVFSCDLKQEGWAGDIVLVWASFG